MFTICALWPWLWREMTLVIMVWSIIWIQACDLEAMAKTLNKTTCTVTLTLDYHLGLKTEATLGLWTPCMYGVIPIQCCMNNRPNSYGQYPCFYFIFVKGKGNTVNCFIFASSNFCQTAKKRQFRQTQYVNSSFQDYQNIVCHRVNFLKNMCLAHMTDMYICLALV